ncbi:hypothetical protein P879_00778 [Paragonimus westermani]|uniref:Uncharacterized protein n=1 Tax=Paragonimus westermani TaxID=34504 RepID=A0A8T0D396_9TREM|nr:hypothetical protein P879_00778 [Paragonimus westermani]
MIQDELLLDPFWSPEHFDSHRPDSVPRCDLSINDSPETECRSSTDLPMCCTPAQLNEAFEAALASVKTSETNNSNAALIESEESLTPGRHLIRLIGQLCRTVASSGVDKLLPYGPVLGRQSARLLLVSERHPLFSMNRRFVQLLECLWCRLYLVMPRRLELLTVNALRECLLHDQGSFDSLIRPKRKLTSLDIRTDPVENLVNGVDPGVFRCFLSVVFLYMRLTDRLNLSGFIVMMVAISHSSKTLVEKTIEAVSCDVSVASFFNIVYLSDGFHAVFDPSIDFPLNSSLQSADRCLIIWHIQTCIILMSDQVDENRRANWQDRRADDSFDDVNFDVSQLKHWVENLTLINSFTNAKSMDHAAARKLAERKATDLQETLLVSELDAKFATACVHTQYQMLQRLFLLRTNESRAEIVRLTRELETLRSESKATISLRDRLLAERDARIEQLETRMKIMYVQLSGVCFDILSHLESAVVGAIEDSQQRADEFHNLAKKELIDCGLDIHLI